MEVTMIRPIKLYNTRTRSVDLLEPLEEGKVGIYSCGPTVYNYAHIGNLRAYVFVDTLKRALQWCGYQTNHIMNITDVGHLTDDASDGEDKMELAAKKSGRDIWDLSRYYTSIFFEHTGDLGIQPPNTVCRATDHIPQQIDMVQTIYDNGFAYQIDDGIYLDTAKLPKYADFARLSIEGQQAGARVDIVQGKKSPTDFAIWKFAKGAKRLMEWESPWGRGFPGWHLECSAMSCNYLGERFDIHTGGIDHIPVHHTNEIAQMMAYTKSDEWVNVWMHNNFLVLEQDGEETKMAKSGANFITLDSIRNWGLQPLAYRYLLLNTHYRKETRFSRTNVEDAAKGLNRLWKRISSIHDEAGGAKGDLNAPTLETYRREVTDGISDDLNTARCLAEVWKIVQDESVAAADKIAFIADTDRVLGLRLTQGPIGGGDAASVDEAKMQKLIQKRNQARTDKDFSTADTIRDALDAVGVRLKDSPEGTTWES